MVIICQRKWCQYNYLQNIIVKQSTICWGHHILHSSEFFLTFHIIGSYVIPAKFHVTPYFSTTGPLSCRLRCCFQMKGQIGVVGRKSKQRAHFNQIPPTSVLTAPPILALFSREAFLWTIDLTMYILVVCFLFTAWRCPVLPFESKVELVKSCYWHASLWIFCLIEYWTKYSFSNTICVLPGGRIVIIQAGSEAKEKCFIL